MPKPYSTAPNAHTLVRARIALDVALSNLARWPEKQAFKDAVEKAQQRVQSLNGPISAATAKMLKDEQRVLLELREEMGEVA